MCAEQTETGEADTIFILEAGATLSNVFIGPAQAEGMVAVQRIWKCC